MSEVVEIKVPDIGDFDAVEVIEILVRPGDVVRAEQSLITVESDKASMEIPSAAAGVVRELRVALGDKVAQGSVVLMLETADGGAGADPSAPVATAAAAVPAAAAAVPAAAAERAVASAAAAAAPMTAGAADRATVSAPTPEPEPAPASAPPVALPEAVQRTHPVPAALHVVDDNAVKPHASPSVRKFARELGVDLAQVRGTGPKLRITPEDVRAYVKGMIAQASAAPAPAAPAADGGAALGLIPWPKVDFARFGPIERTALSRIRRVSGANLHRNWVMIPHVTNHEDADITELEAFRVRLNAEQGAGGVKVTMLAFLIKACVSALKRFPDFNASLDGDSLVYKRYWHIGFAADTPNGLVVPVIRDADTKGVLQLAAEMGELSKKARDGKLSPADMQGGTFSISSLGGIGGTSFTPIVNAPEVAILGVSRAARRPVWDETQDAFVPRLILPLSLSYDHRVIDGAAAARFNAHLAQMLGDFRRAIL
ncbi:MAG TPA: dihydrolipoyllysine-residue acetyltransferase [Quisquiliibacterium sp.]|nr:dihydrolipoyllysine-residue acetyltransferase [Quisquiliibacterium sp.]